jgi:forkhead protein FKH
MTDDSLITTVSQHLLLPNHFVQVAHDHGNVRHQKESKNVQAYAKITGRNWTFYVKRLSTSLGRPPEGVIIPGDSPKTPVASNEGSNLPATPTESSRIHIDLGPNKLVSRLHADIYFEPNESAWKIIVNGRNGAKVNEKLVCRGQHMKLSSGDVIEVAGVEMMFVLPENEYKVRIHPKFLRRAGLIQPDPRDEMLAEQNADEVDKGMSFVQPGRPLNLAPPDYRKPDTPIKTRKGYSTSPAHVAAGGTMMMSADQIDLSLDHNQHIKPMYTYSQLITQALLESPDEEKTLSDIYIFLKKKYAFFRHAENEKGWQVNFPF